MDVALKKQIYTFLFNVVKKICLNYKLNAVNVVEEWVAFAASGVELNMKSLGEFKIKVYIYIYIYIKLSSTIIKNHNMLSNILRERTSMYASFPTQYVTKAITMLLA